MATKSVYEVIENRVKKVVCVDNADDDFFTKGKEYFVVDGKIIDDELYCYDLEGLDETFESVERKIHLTETMSMNIETFIHLLDKETV